MLCTESLVTGVIGFSDTTAFPITHRRRSERCAPFDVFQIAPLRRTDNAEVCAVAYGAMD
jgi:hypothetical protein